MPNRSPLFQIAAAAAQQANDAYHAAHPPIPTPNPSTPPPMPTQPEKEPQKPSQTAETWLCYACDFEYVDGEDSCHNHLCPEGLGTVKAPGWECAECGANDHPTGQCPHTRQTAKQAALALAYDRSQAAAAIIKSAQKLRHANNPESAHHWNLMNAVDRYNALITED